MNTKELSRLCALDQQVTHLRYLLEQVDVFVDGSANSFSLRPFAPGSVFKPETIKQVKALLKRDIEERLGPAQQEFERA
jgi:hypothetical protein